MSGETVELNAVELERVYYTALKFQGELIEENWRLRDEIERLRFRKPWWRRLFG